MEKIVSHRVKRAEGLTYGKKWLQECSIFIVRYTMNESLLRVYESLKGLCHETNSFLKAYNIK